MFSKEYNLVISKIKDRQKLLRRFYFGLLVALLAAVIAAVIPYIYGRLVDIAIAPRFRIEIIAGFILLWLILSLLRDGFSRFSERQAYEISTDVTNILIVDLFHHLINLPLQFHKEKKMGKVMRKIDRGIDDLTDLIERTIFSFFPTVVSFIIALIILLFVEWRLALILIVSSLGYILITLAYTKKIVTKQKIMHKSWEKAYGDLWDSVLNVETVKSMTNENFERRRNLKNFDISGKIFKDWRLIWQKMNTWQRLIFTLSFIAVFSAGTLMLREGILTPGKLIMFVGYVGLLTSPLAQLADQYRIAKTATAAFGRAIQYYDITPEQDDRTVKELKDIKGKVVFEKVNFGYKKSQLILKDISFDVRAGETVALIGESGVGKTTLINLIGKYHLPISGKILIDDIDIREIKSKFLRSKIALVPQEVLLFNDTIRNNIAYGRLEATEREIIEAAKAANAHEFIEKFPDKYDQLVGERGIKLSTGQKQRIAIARAILREPKILILDEATSALDSISEKLVQEALARLIKNRTTFIIAHRLSTIQHAHRIIVLEKGKIAEMGTHKELMANLEGIYRNYWKLQSALQKVE